MWLYWLLLVIVILAVIIYRRMSKEGFENYKMIDRTYQWLYYNLWFPRYEWRDRGHEIISTPYLLVDGPRLIGQAYERLEDVGPEVLRTPSTTMPVEDIIEKCKREKLNCHNIVFDSRTGKSYVNAFTYTDKLVQAPGLVTYVRKYPNSHN